jgi:16S rRNA (uracil1498-N3)-methyltransferase
MVSVSQVTQEEKPEPALVLVQALAKGDRDELAIQAATELGAFAIVPWQAERSVSRWDGPKVAKGVERWQSIVAEAAKQALRAFTPQVSQPVSSKELAKMVSEYSAVLVLDPTAEHSLASAQLPKQGNVAIVVGPEGGISQSELALMEAAGAVRVHLGESILRTSTAGVAAISVLQAKLGHWG